MKTLSHVQGKGCISHNNRTFRPKNVDPEKTTDNITYIRENIKDAYENLFSAAVEEYNTGQKRKDRKIGSYYEHLFSRKPCNTVVESGNGQKSFYEDVVQIGTKDDTGVGTADAEAAKLCLNEYMLGFQKRNPNFYVFNAVMHVDEATPHLHIDYIPLAHYKKGLKIRNGLAKALEEMGYGKKADAISRWRISERDILRKICLEHGIQIEEEQKGRGYSYTVEEYKKHEDKIKEYEAAEKELEQEKSRLKCELEPLKDEKAIIDNIETIGIAMPGGARIVRSWESDIITAQKKALALKQAENDKKSEELLKRKIQLEKQQEKLSEDEKALQAAKETYHIKAEALDDEREKASRLQLQYERKYNEQAELNTVLERTKRELNIVQSELASMYELEQQNKNLTNDNQKLHKLVDDIREHNTVIIDKIKTEKDELVRKHNEITSRLKDEINSLKEERKGLKAFIDMLYEVGEYICRKLGVDFNKILDKRIAGYSLSYIFDHIGQR